MLFFFFFQAEDGIRDLTVTGVQTCALPIYRGDEGGHDERRAVPVVLRRRRADLRDARPALEARGADPGPERAAALGSAAVGERGAGDAEARGDGAVRGAGLQDDFRAAWARRDVFP